MVKIIWTERSLSDLETIAEYIAKDSFKYAQLTIQKIIKKTQTLQNHPRIGRKVPELNKDKFRELIIGNYRVIYTYNVQEITILTVHHSKRNLKKGNF